MRRVVGCLLCLFMVTAPALSHGASFAPAADDRRAKQALPPTGKALIYVFRKEGAADRTDVPLFLDGQRIGTTVPRSYYLWAVDPGRHTVAAKPDQRVALPITVQAGRNYFIEHGVDEGSERVSLRHVSYAQGRVGVNSCKLLQDRSAPAAIALGKPVPKVAKPVAKPAAAEATQRQGVAAILKLGSVKLNEPNQNILTSTVTVPVSFDDKSKSPFGLEVEWRMTNGFALGGELVSYSNKLTAVGTSLQSDMDVTAVLFNAKKYFAASSLFYPFIGAGIGGAATDFSGSAISGNTSGLAFQGMAGVEMRWRQLGLYAEYKALSAKTEDDAGNKVNASVRGVFLGASVAF
ncbi:MAG: outer membrane beta-barrel protein [Pseudomonadota bacterium]|nr:MAG: outer membrane beta-barrel protein [Pseudomonadota bacterium]